MAYTATVFDVETTGFSNNDRIIEIATVSLDTTSGNITDRFNTLINPERNVGPTEVHGIKRGMVESAPTFAEIAHAIAQKIDGSILIAHNLPFDARMLKNEFERVGGKFDPGRGFCTLSVTKMKLEAACHRFGIDLKEAHSAVNDTEATALLAIRLSPKWETLIPAKAEWHGPSTAIKPISRLSIPSVKVVCFTGAAVIRGERYTRARLESIATEHGHSTTSSITRECDMLVAADPNTSSSKARKARQLGIPIISVDDFLSEY